VSISPHEDQRKCIPLACCEKTKTKQITKKTKKKKKKVKYL